MGIPFGEKNNNVSVFKKNKTMLHVQAKKHAVCVCAQLGGFQ